MKTRHLTAIFALAASMTAALASAQTYSGTITASDYTSGNDAWTPEINYSITYNSDKTLTVDCTLSEFNNNNVQVNFGDGFNTMQTVGGNVLQYTFTSTNTYEKGTEFNDAFFWLPYPKNVSRGNFKYTVGATNSTDSEAPVLKSAEVDEIGKTKATVIVTATDNETAQLTYEYSTVEDFSTVSGTATGNPGEATTFSIKGLQPATAYTYYLRAVDAAGNKSDAEKLTFTTETETVIATFYDIIYPSEYAETATDTSGNKITPKISWQAETTEGYEDIIITAKLGEALPEGAIIKFCAYIQNGIGDISGTMTATGNANEYTIRVSDLLSDGQSLSQDQVFGQLFFRIYPTGEGSFSRTEMVYGYYVGRASDPVYDDTEAPTWNTVPTAQNITDRSADIIVNLTDDSTVVTVKITGDNDFPTTTKSPVAAEGKDQTITVTGLKASTTYNISITAYDAAGNTSAEKTLQFTTTSEKELDVLYTRIYFTSEDWTKHSTSEDSNTFAPNGDILLAVNADNTISATVTVESDGDLIDNSQFILHDVESPFFAQNVANVFTTTTTAMISDRAKQLAFHCNFVLKNGKGNSELKVMYFTPDKGDTSGVKAIESEGAKVIACNGTIRVADGKQFTVYTVAGQKVYAGNEAASLSHGVYVVVVEGKATKVVL